MPARPAFSVPPVTPAEMEQLVARAGLALNPGQMADLVLAWRQTADLLARLPRDRPLIDDVACLFRLPPPLPPTATSRKPEPAIRGLGKSLSRKLLKRRKR